MSEITVNVRETRTTWHWTLNLFQAQGMVACLAADPANLAEFQTALGRFMATDMARTLISNGRAGLRTKRGKKGQLLIDLPGRVVAGDFDDWQLRHADAAPWSDDEKVSETRFPYCLADHWQLTSWQDGKQAAEQRRRELAARQPLDTRAVLYDRLAEALVQRWNQSADTDEDRVVNVHIGWLATPRSDLEGASPRQILLSAQDDIDRDISHQELRWSVLQERPPALPKGSPAYRYGGFGTHEIVLYYDLVRHLLSECEQRWTGKSRVNLVTETIRLDKLKQQWLHTPSDSLHGQTPIQVIHLERSRLPLMVTAEQAMIDCDCPLCQLMFEDLVFFHLDGMGMDEEYEFSFCRTREEWEREQQQWQEFCEQTCDEPVRDAELAMVRSDSPWDHCYTNWQSLEDVTRGEGRQIMLHAVAGCLAELNMNLKEEPHSQHLAASLAEQFGALCDCVRSNEAWRMATVMHLMDDELNSVRTVRPSLQLKCDDFMRHLQKLCSYLD